MKRFAFIFLPTLLLSFHPVDAQTITNYTKANTSKSLCNDVVTSIAVDDKGNKWFGTTDGLSNFDNNNWKNYTSLDGLAGNIISIVTIDKKGNKWIGTDNG